jgi:serine/threonine-protein kinase
MSDHHNLADSLVAPEVDGVQLYRDVEERFSDLLQILRLVAASTERALFVARDRVLKRHVALRVHLRPDTQHRVWFERETELLAALDHPVLRSVYSAGYRDDWAFRIVKWIEGESLADRVGRGPRPIPSVLQLARSLSAGLEYVHLQHIVVRHLDPTTVMIDNTERTLVTDMRYANVLLDVAMSPPTIATNPFLAPEVRDGRAGEPASDIYSAGALLYLAVTGDPPALDITGQVQPRAVRTACPAALERVIMRALAPDPKARFLTAVEMANDVLSGFGDFTVPVLLAAEQSTPQEDQLAWEKRLRRALGDDYELLGELGSGAFGRVYRVRDLTLEREVALKVLHPYLTTDPAVVERFRREARAAAQVMHPNIANTYDFAGRAGLIWYTMEYVHGNNLGHLVRSEGPLAPDRIVRILHEALDGLRYAHERGLVHRDLKPENLLIEDGTGAVHIADFGLVIAFGRDAAGGTASHSGTPDFAAPEQLLGEPVDHRADLYSLSLVGLFALTGRPPFGGGSIETTLARQTTGQIGELDELRRTVPAGLLRVLERGASRLPDDRFASAEEYARALRAATQPGSSGFRDLFRWLSGPS